MPDYLEQMMSGQEMRGISDHLEECLGCKREAAALTGTRAMLAALGRKQAPPDLAMRLTVALSRERQRTTRRLFDDYRIRLANALNGMMLPASAGILTAVVIFGVLIGFIGPSQIDAPSDVPTILYKPPKLSAAGLYSGYAPAAFDAPLLVETYVDANGRVNDYKIVAGDDTQETRAELNRTLIFTVFEPAMAFGRRVPGRVVLSFSNVRVRG